MKSNRIYELQHLTAHSPKSFSAFFLYSWKMDGKVKSIMRTLRLMDLIWRIFVGWKVDWLGTEGKFQTRWIRSSRSTYKTQKSHNLFLNSMVRIYMGCCPGVRLNSKCVCFFVFFSQLSIGILFFSLSLPLFSVFCLVDLRWNLAENAIYSCK